MAVLAIVAILAGSVVLTMAGPLGKARTGDAVAKLRELDRWTRYDARHFARPARLVFDLDNGMACRDSGERSRIVTLPPGYVLVAMRDGQGTTRSGETHVECSDAGRTTSYALAVAGPDHVQTWVIFAGLTGQSTLARDESEVDAFFSSLTRSLAGVR
jgi:hypothetical protein